MYEGVGVKGMKDVLISVIVPVYKVEKYIDKCVESLVNQTYGDIEIILVDDGSPDLCAQKIDEWEKKDRRIKALHKPNGGVSSARNFGIEKSAGEYIAFVDGDDYCDPDLYEFLLNLALNENSDLSRCGFIIEDQIKNLIDISGDEHAKKEIFDKNDYDSMIASAIQTGYSCGSVWNKLYKRETMGDLRFDESLSFCEDLWFNYNFIKRASKVVYCDVPKYHYVKRDGSASFTNTTNNYLEVTEKIVSLEEQGRGKAYNYAVRSFTNAVTICVNGSIEYGEKYINKSDLRKKVKKYKHIIFSTDTYTLRSKVKLFLFIYLYFIYYIFAKIKYIKTKIQ